LWLTTNQVLYARAIIASGDLFEAALEVSVKAPAEMCQGF
jgi:hypothetical protein